jgi:hypothetical protein
MVATAIVGSAVGSALVGAYSADRQSSAARRAANSQNASNDAALEQNQLQFDATMAFNRESHAASLALQRHIAGMQIGENRRQFNEVQKVLSPFINAGNQALEDLQPYQQAGLDALSGQRALIGLDGASAQQQAIAGLSNSPEMAAYIQQGEDALLQNAAATGGLRGGNTQGALAQFRPGILAGMINQQYDRLGGLTGLGANTTGMVYQTGASAAAGQANAGMQVAGNIGAALGNYAQGAGSAYNSLMAGGNAAMGQMGAAYNNYYNNQGSINAGMHLAQGNAQAQMANSIGSALGSYAMLQTLKGGTSNPAMAPYMAPNTNVPAANYSLNSGGGQGLRGTF